MKVVAQDIRILPPLISIGNSKSENKIGGSRYLARIMDILDINAKSSEKVVESMPFSLNDTTAGSENEFQVVVVGEKEDVDLPRIIEQSNFYKNILKRTKTGEAPKKIIAELDRYLNDNSSRVWENSWVDIPRSVLSSDTSEIFESDLLYDKSDPSSLRRGDVGKFIFTKNGEDFLRIPISYLLKLALIDAISSRSVAHPLVISAGKAAAHHFLNDNTSPETYSFMPVLLSRDVGMGRGLARETALRFLLTQLLIMYANIALQLISLGQKAMIYFAPHPPVRQKILNEIIPDSFYRTLFMNPCLSGWDRGEEKYDYMGLCHRVLSRSQLNAVIKLKDAGIIINNLFVLPSISNIGLANNGTHISLGSRKLTRLLRDVKSGYREADEKYFGDLVIKIAEHFLPLFVGAYSAAPYRLDFADFHPERALGFMPHELDYTHLRMIWRRWKKKARFKIFGQPITPFGPKWFDMMISRLFGLRGDFVQDFRLIDYFVSLMSTDESPALDGTLGNDIRLRRDLADLGVFDPQMTMYLLYRNRQYASSGFSGFEGRHYSLFHSIIDDMGEATNLQALMTALAYKYSLRGEISHDHIPDDPSVESERRQIFFGTAIGIPTFYVRKNSENRFLMKIIAKTEKNRHSHRYPGYIRVHNLEYRKALIKVIKEDAADLIDILGLSETIRDLEARILDPDNCATAKRIEHGILREIGTTSPLKVSGYEFNRSAEEYYRTTLSRRHTNESITVLEEELALLDADARTADSELRQALHAVLNGWSAAEYFASVKSDLINEKVHSEVLRKLISVLLMVIHRNRELSTSYMD
ncbi:MAG: hypothetical protein JXC33_04990 [Deltaproteobacteria bacterium]|nr:hypothetical protein [Deltaproteobacteria bacterium]